MKATFIIKKSVRDVLMRRWMTYVPPPMKHGDDELHLREAVEWLMRAIEHGEGGVSSHYSLMNGRWLAPFPETTGYVIPTLFDYAARSGDARFAHTAVRLADWLGEVQLDDGACMQGSYDRRRGKTGPIIFNTGQNIFGFLRAHEETGAAPYLDRAVRAGDFLVRQTDEKGIWNRALHHGIPHTYNSRTAWALLELFETTGHVPYRDVAVHNLNWVVARQEQNGWFRNAHFKPRELPNTHGLAYTLRGLLESHRLTGEQAYLNAAQKTAEKFLRLFEIRKTLYVFWDSAWRNHGKFVPRTKGRHVCVTGNVQLAIVWMRLFEPTGDARYVNAAFKMIDFVKSLQDLDTPLDGVRGGIPGAFPIFGSYSTLKYPNWAAKFYADALMMKSDFEKDARRIRQVALRGVAR